MLFIRHIYKISKYKLHIYSKYNLHQLTPLHLGGFRIYHPEVGASTVQTYKRKDFMDSFYSAQPKMKEKWNQRYTRSASHCVHGPLCRRKNFMYKGDFGGKCDKYLRKVKVGVLIGCIAPLWPNLAVLLEIGIKDKKKRGMEVIAATFEYSEDTATIQEDEAGGSSSINDKSSPTTTSSRRLVGVKWPGNEKWVEAMKKAATNMKSLKKKLIGERTETTTCIIHDPNLGLLDTLGFHVDEGGIVDRVNAKCGMVELTVGCELVNASMWTNDNTGGQRDKLEQQFEKDRNRVYAVAEGIAPVLKWNVKFLLPLNEKEIKAAFGR